MSKRIFSSRSGYLLLFALLLAVIVACYSSYTKNIRESRAAAAKALANEKKLKEIAGDIKAYGVYYKIRDRDPVNCLVVGDSIGESDRASADGMKWYNRLGNFFINTYGIIPAFSLAVHPGADIQTALADYEKKPGKGYDLVFVCYGQNDRAGYLHTFASAYETLVRDVIANNPRGDLYLMAESSFQTDAATGVASNRTDIPGTIKQVAGYYGLAHVDLGEAVRGAGRDADELTIDGVHPNDAGYALYAGALEKVIDSNRKAEKKISREQKARLFD